MSKEKKLFDQIAYVCGVIVMATIFVWGLSEGAILPVCLMGSLCCGVVFGAIVRLGLRVFSNEKPLP